MSSLTDDQIRAALQHVASRAPDPARVLSHLADRRRRHRQRRALLMAGGAVGAAAAIVAPVVLLSRGRPSTPADDDGWVLPDVRTLPNLPSPAPEPAAGPGNTSVPLRYRPTYLPDDYVEVFRIVSVAGATYQAREWHQMQTDPTLTPGAVTLILAPDADLPSSDRALEITVNGALGLLAPEDAEVAQVVWSIGGGLSLAVEARHMDDGLIVVQDVARSVEPDNVAGLEIPLAFGYLPPNLPVGQQATIQPDGDGWVLRVALMRDRDMVGAALLGAHVSYGPGPSAVATQLRGRPGLVELDGHGNGTAFVSLESGLNLFVRVPNGVYPVTADDLVRVTNEMTIGSPPYVGWIWQR
jgi:hypothetical protein